MTALRQATAEAAAKLRRAEQDYARLALLHEKLGDRRRSVWSRLADIAARLEALAELFFAREASKQQLSDLKRLSAGSRPTSVEFEKRDVRFDVLRLFRFQSYAATCWSIYDALWASLVPIVGNHQKAIFLGNCITGNPSKVGGPSAMLSRLYGWSVGFFYAVRNELVHEAANALEGGRVFLSPEVGFDFEISDEFLARVSKECTKSEWALHEGLSTRDGWPWSRELDVLLQACENDVDTVFAHISEWAVEVLARELAIMASATTS